LSKRDYYEVLGVARGVSDQELKSAYRKLAMQHHPDRNPDNHESEEKFKEAAEAYTVLSNGETRARYDRYGHSGVASSASSGAWNAADFGGLEDILGDLFGDLFGTRNSRRTGAQRGSDLRYDLEITLEQAAAGVPHENRDPQTPCLRDLFRIRSGSRNLADNVQPLRRCRTGPVPARLLLSQPHVSSMPRGREDHHLAVQVVLRSGSH
jgi:curved DNA-binding protein CbpA